MNSRRLMRLVPVACLLTGLAAPLAAQITTPAANTTTARDADMLAGAMRILASDAYNIDALLTAAEAATRLGDLSAAGSLFGRAERIAPGNTRLKAGLGSLLVRVERPGEALRRFAEAEAGGFDASRFAADRALAYDLTGDQQRAQRDYRTALKTTQTDEIMRRYALSLGISGKRDQALAALEPLIRRGDRAAWRDRAFVLAMTGDVPGAQQIATSTLPAGVGQALTVFFARLVSLGPADRAWAVHFGELRPTPERLADARLAPVLPPLPPEPKPIQVATAPTQRPMTREEQRRLAREERRARDRRVQLARVTPPLAAAPVQPVQAPPAPRTAAAPPIAARVAPTAPTLRPAPPIVHATVQPRVPVPSPAPEPRPFLAMTVPAPIVSQPRRDPAPPVGLAATTAEPGFTAPSAPLPAPPRPSARAASEDSILAKIVAGIGVPGAELDIAPVRRPAIVPVPAPAPPVRKVELADTVSRRSAIKPAVPDAPLPARKAHTPVKPIVAEEEAAPAKARRPVTSKLADSDADAISTRRKSRLADVEDAKLARVRGKGKGAATRTDDEDDTTLVHGKGTKNASSGDAAAKPTRNGLARKGAKAKVDGDEGDTDVPARSRKGKLAKADAPRIWVQVAGGRNADDLDKAWSKVRKTAPETLKGKQGYKTPLRATNRVLTGPFKTDEEAQAVVNQLRKKGVPAFSFTSTAGQKVEKLDE